ncbi:MAG: MFS transporter [Gammaproteobacteria bacterium]|nr:MFS transporter [Gammaproteobacteria bacterium]
MTSTTARVLAARIPFFYGWVILACAMCASFARQAAAVATLSIFIVPMTTEFDWSRSEISGAVSLGGLLAALISPAVGTLIDRSGARAVLTISILLIALTVGSLAMTETLVWFYVAFTFGRMLFASPFDLGTSGAVANWFVRRRALAMSWLIVATGLSLAVMPLLAQLTIDAHGWRAGWVAIALAVLVVGALPNSVLMVRRPEDVGLRTDGDAAPLATSAGGLSGSTRADEGLFTRAMALRTPAFWLLMLYTALIFPVQAGISLHQAPHLIQRGIDPTTAALIVGAFAAAAAASSLVFGWLGGRWPVRFGLSLAAGVTAIAAMFMLGVTSVTGGFCAALLFGSGIGGVLTLVPVAFAEYFGRLSYGTVRGIALPVQVVGQAAGPILAGVLYDLGGSYANSLSTFAVLAAGATVLALFARPPR